MTAPAEEWAVSRAAELALRELSWAEGLPAAGGGGGGGASTGQAGSAGGNYGAGGGGGGTAAANVKAGGAGADGVIIITYTPIPAWVDAGYQGQLPKQNIRPAHRSITGGILPQPPILPTGSIEAAHVNAPMDPARKRVLKGTVRPDGRLSAYREHLRRPTGGSHRLAPDAPDPQGDCPGSLCPNGRLPLATVPLWGPAKRGLALRYHGAAANHPQTVPDGTGTTSPFDDS